MIDNIKELIERLPLSQVGGNVLIDLGQDVLFIDGHKGSVCVGQGNGSPDVVFKVSADDLHHLLNGEEDAIALFTQGKVEITGDMDIAFRLKEILI